MDAIDPLTFFLLSMMLTIDKPYSMGIFETIINVHFGDGLAVEFFNRAA